MEDRQEYVQGNFRWNFATNLTETSLTLFGRGFVSPGTFLPVFVSLFTESKVLIGLVGASIPVGFLLPQLFVAPWVERWGRKKPLVVRLAAAEKMLYMVLAGLALVSLRMPSNLLVALFIALCFLIGLSGGVTQIGWSELMATIFPREARGRYFGTTFFVGGLLGALGAYLGGLVLSRFELPANYATTFFIGFTLSIVSWTFLLWIREPAPAPKGPGRVGRPYSLSGLVALLRRDRSFSSFIVAQSGAVLSGMAVAFLAVFGQERFTLSGYQIGLLSTSLLLGGSLACLLFGWLGDRFSHRRVLIGGLGIKVIGLVLALAASNELALYISGFVLGIGATKVNVQPLVYDYAPVERRPTYIGLASTAFGLVSVISPLIGGLVAEAFGYIVLFGGSVVLSVAALILYLILVEEPAVAGRTASAHGAHG
jgi:MFS family permease